MTYFEIIPIPDVFLPNGEDLGDGVAFEKLDVGDNVKKRRLMHPIRQSHNLCREQLFSALSLELLLQTLGVDLHDSVSRNGIIFFICRLFLILVAIDDLQIVWPKHLCIEFLDAVDEFYGSSVAVLCEKRYCHVSRFYCLQNVAHRFVDKESILNLTLRLLTSLPIKAFDNLTIVRF